MKSIVGLILLILIFGFVSIQAQQVNLPKDCVKILNKKFRDWKLAKINPEITNYWTNSKLPYKPNLIGGDWNSDGKIDFAVMIESGKIRLNGESFEPRVLIIAFIRTSTTYSFHLISDDNYEYIAFIRKGEKGYNYETTKNFTYKNDAIFAGYFEKAGSSYIWRKGKFIGIVTSD